MGTSWLGHLGRAGLELRTSMLTLSSEEDAGGFSENRVAFQRFLGNMEPREVTNRKEKGGHSCPCGFQGMEEALLRWQG